MATKTESATDAWVRLEREAAGLMDAIREAIGDEMDRTPPERIHWGHVGSLGYVVEQLRNAATVIRGE